MPCPCGTTGFAAASGAHRPPLCRPCPVLSAPQFALPPASQGFPPQSSHMNDPFPSNPSFPSCCCPKQSCDRSDGAACGVPAGIQADIPTFAAMGTQCSSPNLLNSCPRPNQSRPLPSPCLLSSLSLCLPPTAATPRPLVPNIRTLMMAKLIDPSINLNSLLASSLGASLLPLQQPTAPPCSLLSGNPACQTAGQPACTAKCHYSPAAAAVMPSSMQSSGRRRRYGREGRRCREEGRAGKQRGKRRWQENDCDVCRDSDESSDSSYGSQCSCSLVGDDEFPVGQLLLDQMLQQTDGPSANRSQKDSQQRGRLTIPSTSLRGTPRGSPAGSPGGSLRGSPRGSPGGSRAGSVRGTVGGNVARDLQRTLQKSLQGSLRATPRGSGKETPAGGATAKASPVGTPRVSPGPSLRGSPRGTMGGPGAARHWQAAGARPITERSAYGPGGRRGSESRRTSDATVRSLATSHSQYRGPGKYYVGESSVRRGAGEGPSGSWEGRSGEAGGVGQLTEDGHRVLESLVPGGCLETDVVPRGGLAQNLFPDLAAERASLTQGNGIRPSYVQLEAWGELPRHPGEASQRTEAPHEHAANGANGANGGTGGVRHPHRWSEYSAENVQPLAVERHIEGLRTRPYYHYELPTISQLAQASCPNMFRPPRLSLTPQML